MPSLVIAALPVNAAAQNFVAATATFPASAARTTRVSDLSFFTIRGVARYFAAAACSMSFVTASGCDPMPTCDASLTTTVSFESAVHGTCASAAGGMFRSRSP
jgi:hypothetical protein